MRSPEHEMSLFVEGFWKTNLSFDAAPVGAAKYFQVILRPSWSLFFIKITCCIFQGLVRPLWTWIIYLWNQRTANFAFDRRGETNGHYHFLRVIVFVMMIIIIIFLRNGSNSGLFWGSKHHHPHPQQYNTKYHHRCNLFFCSEMAATLVCFEAGSNAGTVPTPLLHRPIGEDHQYYHHGDYLYHGNDCHQSDDCHKYDDYDDKDDDLISVENHPHLILSITIVIIFITTLCCSTISTSRSLFF